MGKCIITMSGGSSVDTDELTATSKDLLSDKTAICHDSDEPVNGTMVNNGAVSSTLNCGSSYTIPEGYHNGNGKITANTLASQTTVQSGKTAAGAGQILTDYEAWVNGNRVTGSMANQGAKTSSLNCGGSYTIPAGYHNGSGKVTANSLSSQTSATAAAGDILTGKTAYVNGNKVTGTMATLAGGTYTPGTGQQTISCSGKKMTSNIVINAIPSTYVNISSGSVAVFNMGSVSYIGEFVACGSSGSYEDGTLNSSGTLPGFNDDGSMNYGGSKGGICFKRSVDMTSFSKIRITYTPNTSNPGTQKIGVANTSKTILIASGWTPERKTTSTSSTTLCILDIDISSIKQQAVFFLHSNGLSASIIIKKIELIV